MHPGACRCSLVTAEPNYTPCREDSKEDLFTDASMIEKLKDLFRDASMMENFQQQINQLYLCLVVLSALKCEQG